MVAALALGDELGQCARLASDDGRESDKRRPIGWSGETACKKT